MPTPSKVLAVAVFVLVREQWSKKNADADEKTFLHPVKVDQKCKSGSDPIFVETYRCRTYEAEASLSQYVPISPPENKAQCYCSQ